MIVVSDTSPLSSLIQVRSISLLEQLYARVLIPKAVHEELKRAHPVLPPFVEVRQAQNTQQISRLRAELDAGEAEAIVLAKEAKAELLLIDEKLGRKIAARERVPVIGLMGILVEAKRRNLIGSVRRLVDELEQVAGFRVSPAVKAEVFAEAGE